MHSSNEDQRATKTVDEVETGAYVMPAPLPASAMREAAWRSRWTLERVERRLGPRPESRIVERWSMTATLLPTSPPVEEGVGASNPVLVRVEQDELLDSVAERLDYLPEISADAVAETLVRRIRGFDSPGWILILCMPDGTATWGLPPTTARVRLTNADAVRPAVDALLPEE